MDNYAALYEVAISLVPPGGTVFELGCGTGVFGSMLIDKCDHYKGYDIDEEALKQARLNNPGYEDCFVSQDINHDDAYKHMGTYVALEVLEHIPHDLVAISKIRKGCRVVISVPSFDSEDHRRYFPYEYEAIDRYEDVLDIDLWRKIKIPTGGGYFHLMRGFR